MNTIRLLESYLGSLNIEKSDYVIEGTQDTLGFLITLKIKKDNPMIGVLRGKAGQNLEVLKSILRIVGATERIRPSIKIEYTDEISK